ncbi:tyrosine-protein phosphatase [Microvirga alba]|uniref:Tyrosine-protein phosphatase n=1 Tax=Microvirga alba TaxID=2791025 RepID=A0A931BYQ4_9HYPH|nr:tyrosine-protein phosphatase [Microvirga alba]MBF9235262.1 tyrosine-protein phosphatase [Microvirga alba]
MTNSPGRLIALAGAHNIRDLGGYALRGGGQTRWRSILRADGLHNLMEDAQAELVRNGLRTVIDLRNAAELSAAPNPFRTHPDVVYHNIPLFSALAPIHMSHDPSRGPFDMSVRYCDAIDLCQPAISKVIVTIAAAEDGGVLFHCSAGKDRTGIIAALLLSAVGASEDVVIDDYALTETVASPLIARLRAEALARGTAPDLADGYLACEPALMRRTFDHLNRAYGGVRAYLSQLEINDAILARLERRLTVDSMS